MISKDRKKNITCSLDDVREDLGPPHSTKPAAVITNKIYIQDPLEALKTFKGMCFGPYCATILVYT